MVTPETDEWKNAEVRLDLDFLRAFGHGIGKLYYLGQDYHITACLAPVRTLPDPTPNERQEFSTLERSLFWKQTEPWNELEKYVFTVDRDRVPDWGLCPCLQKPENIACQSGKCYMATFSENHEFGGQGIAARKSQLAPLAWKMKVLWPTPPEETTKVMLGVDGVLNMYLLWRLDYYTTLVAHTAVE
jgi:hypothetical protein